MNNVFKVGVVGAGNMGSGIAQKMAQEGLFVTLVDMKEEYVQRGLDIIRKMLDQGVQRKVFTEAQMEDTLGRITCSTDYNDLKDMDLIVEAIFEDKNIKGELFKRLDGICEEKTIFASNTSSFYVSELAKNTNRPDRFIGMHYFYHPAKNRLLEVISHEGTSAETLEKTMLIGKLHGKTNIVVKDSPGFAVNRFFVPFLTFSVRAVELGLGDIPTVEQAVKEAFEIGMGPFELMNLTGIPIAAHSSANLGNEIADYYGTPELLEKQTASKELWDYSGNVDESKVEGIKRFLYGSVLGIACNMVDEGVASVEDTDRGAKIGLRWKLGPFELINKLGVDMVYDCVLEVKKHYPEFVISKILKEHYDAKEAFEFNFVDMEVKNGVAYLTINRPEAMNALNETVVDQLEKKFNVAEKDESIKAIAIKGAGKAFIAGADINFFVKNIKNNQIENNVAFTRKGHELLRRMETSDKITVAVVDGLSLGGGSELAFACQAIVATDAGSFGFPETGIGIYPGLGGMLRSSKIMGKELSKYYVLTGDKISAKTAYDLGLVTTIVDTAEIEATIEKLAVTGVSDKYSKKVVPKEYEMYASVFTDENIKKFLQGEGLTEVDPKISDRVNKIMSRKAPLAVRIANELMDAQEKVTIDEGIEMELGRLAEIFSSDDALLGLTAKPGTPLTYTGR
jgi:enoyl-CoA hydratase/3-hydroxyacyl-CoA dehydrogenase